MAHRCRWSIDCRFKPTNYFVGERQIKIVHGNVLGIDAADATAAFVYLLPAGMAAVKETLVSLLKRGGRVASYGKIDGLLSKVKSFDLIAARTPGVKLSGVHWKHETSIPGFVYNYRSACYKKK